jgi:hypothetical protein
MAFFIPILVLAHKITGDSVYRSSLARFDLILDRLLMDDVPTNCNIVSLFMEGFDLAINEGYDDVRLREVIRRLWQARLRDTERCGLWNDDPGDSFVSSRALRIAAFASIVDRNVPGAEAWTLGIRLLQGMTDPRKMLYACTAPDALPPLLRHRALSLCETSITSWLVGYWSLAAEASAQEHRSS